MTLNDLHTGDSAIIARIRGRGAFRKRLTEMGFIRGKSIAVVKSAPLKDPVEYRILDSNISLRRSEASLVEVVSEADFQSVSGGGAAIISDAFQRGPVAPRPGKIIGACGKLFRGNRRLQGSTLQSQGLYLPHY